MEEKIIKLDKRRMYCFNCRPSRIGLSLKKVYIREYKTTEKYYNGYQQKIIEKNNWKCIGLYCRECNHIWTLEQYIKKGISLGYEWMKNIYINS